MTQKNDETMPELKPCPFCGDLDEINIRENTTSPVMNRPPNIISCDITHWCKTEGLPKTSIKVTGRDKLEAAQSWNTSADRPDPELAEVRALLVDIKEMAKSERQPRPVIQEAAEQAKAILDRKIGGV